MMLPDAEIAKKIEQTTERFERFIYPILQKKFSASDYIPIEGIRELLNKEERELSVYEKLLAKLCENLDETAGVDYIIVTPNGLMTIASRIQTHDLESPFLNTTWTTRCKPDPSAPAEYSKRKTAIDNNRLYPYLTIQAYISEDGEELICYGIIHTKDLFRYYKSIEGKKDWDRKICGEDGHGFIYCDWKKIDRTKYQIITDQFMRWDNPSHRFVRKEEER